MIRKSTGVVQKKSLRMVMFLSLLIVAVFASMLQVRAANNDGVKPKKITAVGKKTITVTVGNEFDLKVKMTPKNADEDTLRWKIISGSKYVKFDGDTSDDEVELIAKKAGTAKVRCRIQGTKKQVIFTIKVKAAAKKIQRVSPKDTTIEAGEEFELKVKKYTGLKDRYLVWSIANEDVVMFDDEDKCTGEDVDFYAAEAGTTTITCKNTKTGQTLKFTVVVTEPEEEYDDEDDEDYDDEDYEDEEDDNEDDDEDYEED